MRDGEGVLWVIAANFALLSLIAVGGIHPIIPELHRQTVDVHGWMTSGRFTDLFAIAQGAPGPNILVVSLIGWDIAGFVGAIVATVSICGPSGILAYVVSHLWDRYRFARWRIVIQAGLIPVTIGLVAAGAYVIARAADVSVVAFAITLGTTLVVFYTRLHPLVPLGAGAALGVAGLI